MCAADRDTSAQSQGVSLHKNIKSLPNWENFLDTQSLAANRAYLSAQLQPKSANFVTNIAVNLFYWIINIEQLDIRGMT